MTLHIFNPEHDLAMAANLKNFTASHSVRAFRTDMGFLPALWAGDDDMVMVEDAKRAYATLKKIRARLAASGCKAGGNVEFVMPGEIAGMKVEKIDVWGWDSAIVNSILQNGIICDTLPDMGHLEMIRKLSHRQTATGLLKKFAGDIFVGESFFCGNVDMVAELLYRYGRIVIKAPWSCSGRGIRFAE